GATNSSPMQLTVSTTATSLKLADATGPYGGTTTLSATLKSGAAQTAVSGQTISFSMNGNSVGSAVTNANGGATLTPVSLAGIAGGTYPQYIQATFAGNAMYNAVTNYAELTVTPVDQTITFNSPGDQLLVSGFVGISATDSASLQVTFTSTTTPICTVG